MFFNMYSLSTYSDPGTVLGTRLKTDEIPIPVFLKECAKGGQWREIKNQQVYEQDNPREC